MLSKLSALLDRHLSGGDATPDPLDIHQKQLAMAALLVEVAMADQHFSLAELDHLVLLLEKQFSLSAVESKELAELANAQSADATSLHQFTQLINRVCSHSEKFALLSSMWEIAYADGQLDKYEEYVIRKVADLLHLPHSDFIRAKNLINKARS